MVISTFLKLNGGGVFFAWEDTNQLLTYDEMRDIEVVYNALLIQQYADGLD